MTMNPWEGLGTITNVVAMNWSGGFASRWTRIHKTTICTNTQLKPELARPDPKPKTNPKPRLKESKQAAYEIKDNWQTSGNLLDWSIVPKSRTCN